jgi:hypothetical protein
MKITAEKSVLCRLSAPETIAYLNVYEEGDVWVKIKSCEDCSLTNKKKCCGDCPYITAIGDCAWHLEKNKSSKPWYCIIWPTPDRANSRCMLEFKCVKGMHKGKIRKVCKPTNQFD